MADNPDRWQHVQIQPERELYEAADEEAPGAAVVFIAATAVLAALALVAGITAWAAMGGQG